MIIPRPYQEEAINSIYHYFMNGGRGNPIIALPTASGKSIIPAIFIERVLKQWPNQRFLIITHVSVLITQNADKLLEVWANAPMGIHSAGLKQRDILAPIIFGGIQSMIKIAEAFGHRDIIFVDECFTNDTEILTDKGFIRFDELGLQNIAQWDQETKEISFTKPVRYIKRKPSSPVMHMYTEKGIDITATANHEMIATSATGKLHKRKLIDVISAQYSRLPVAGLGIGEQIELTNFEKLVIAFQADGNIHRRNIDGTSISAFSFSKERKIEAFIKLMNNGNFRWEEVSGKASNNPNVKPRRRFMVYYDFYLNKDVTNYFDISKLSAKKAYDIIEYMNIWDGHIASKNSYLYTNTDKKAVDFYQSVATLAGHRTNMVKVVDNRSENFSDCYRLFIIKNKDTIGSQQLIREEIAYDGDVYCVEMPKGTVITRKNGKVIITGNCHLVSQDENSQYLKFFAVMKRINPNVRIVGLSATKFRMGQGLLTDDGLFTDIIYDMTDMEGFNKLLNEGYLSPLIPQSRVTKLNVSNVDINHGEFAQKQLQYEVDRAEITWKALQETVYYGQNRCSWLIFASGIEHSNHIAEMLGKLGIECASVHSKQSAEYNNAALKAHKNLKLRAISSFSKLTTGLDHPAVDLIDDLNPSLSVVKHVQKYGRGMRLSPETGKTNCLVLDHANNILRLGPVNDPRIPRKKGEKTGDLPVKICDACGVYNHISARKCDACGTPFEFQVKIVERAGTEELIKQPEALVIDYFDVNHVIYKPRQKQDKPPFIEVTYFSGMNSFKEYVFPQSRNRSFFANWWRQRSTIEVPATAEEAIKYTSELRRPSKIRVHVNRMIKGKNWPEVLNAEW